MPKKKPPPKRASKSSDLSSENEQTRGSDLSGSEDVEDSNYSSNSNSNSNSSGSSIVLSSGSSNDSIEYPPRRIRRTYGSRKSARLVSKTIESGSSDTNDQSEVISSEAGEGSDETKHGKINKPPSEDKFEMSRKKSVGRFSRASTVASKRQVSTYKAFRPSGSRQHKEKQPLYCLSWSKDIHVGKDENGDPINVRYLATCGSNNVVIYEVEIDNPSGIFAMKQSYKDGKQEEQFFACVYAGRSSHWNRCRVKSSSTESSPTRFRIGQKRRRSDSNELVLLNSDEQIDGLHPLQGQNFSSDGPQLLCVAGYCGVIKVIDPVQKLLLAELYGHGSDIYDLKVSPADESQLLSCSVDESIRLWNLQSLACVAIFAGHHGHREPILSISWHPLGEKFASSSMDKSIRLWDIGEGRISEAIQASRRLTPTGDRRTFQPLVVHFPYFATDKVHLNYVDCVRFVGDLLLSKSTYNSIVLWQPDLPTESADTGGLKTKNAAIYSPPCDVIALRTFDLDHCDIWYVRFGVDHGCRLLAVGNIKGEVDIWDIDSCKKRPSQRLKPIVNSTIRMLSFSPEGTTLVACNDNATVCKWDVK